MPGAPDHAMPPGCGCRHFQGHHGQASFLGFDLYCRLDRMAIVEHPAVAHTPPQRCLFILEEKTGTERTDGALCPLRRFPAARRSPVNS
ncbi:MAG: hypothetical protein LBI35_08365 [Burkholderiales bacterium]|nr:hypothetical protein [Burkholderiales bacterium]